MSARPLEDAPAQQRSGLEVVGGPGGSPARASGRRRRTQPARRSECARRSWRGCHRAFRRGGAPASPQGRVRGHPARVYMPGMDGYETAQIIRSRDQTKSIPILFLSAVNKEAEHLLRGYAMGRSTMCSSRSRPSSSAPKSRSSSTCLPRPRRSSARLARSRRCSTPTSGPTPSGCVPSRNEARRAAPGRHHPIDADAALFGAVRWRPAKGPFVPQRRLRGDHRLQVRRRRREPDLWADRLHPEDHERVVESPDDRRSMGRLSVEYRWQHANGDYRHFSIRQSC